MRLKPFIVLSLIILLQSQVYTAWVPYEKVIAVVNNRAIMESEIDQKFEKLKTTKKIPASRINYEKSRLLDQMIENELIFEVAEEESIVVSDKKVVQQLEESLARFFSSRIPKDADLKKTVEKVSKEMERFMEKRFETNYKIEPDLKMFIDYIEKTERMDFISFFNEVRVKITREQIISLTIGMTPPSPEDARKWYNANRSKLGFEVYVKHILIIPKSGSLSDEREANNKAEDIRRQILSNPASFESLAVKHSQDPGSSKNGGDLGWQMIAQFDPYFANSVAGLSRKGEISTVFKSGFGYHIVKYMGRRDITYEKVERMIMYMLYTEKGQEQFKKWIQQKREEASVII
ncbi:MAG: peptidylprolyl isomerase, partial [Leptospirales bacterium]|nr:peptidylprolyl isomerase [Leptospirales bacterium]